MRTMIQLIKSINFRQVVTVFLASCLLAFSTACSQGNLAQTGGKTYTETAKQAMSDTYDDYDANQSYKGGMNGYNDDPRYGADTAAKAKTLVDSAKRRQKNIDDVGDYVENISDRAGNKVEAAKRDIPRKVEKNREQAVDYIQDKSENLKDNLSKVPGGAKEVFEEATGTAQNALEDANQAANRTGRELKSNVKDLT